MILLIGIPTETPLALVEEELRIIGAASISFNQRIFEKCQMQMEIHDGRISGNLRIDNRNFDLNDFSGIYNRAMDDTNLPELQYEPPGSPKRQYCRALHETLMQWSEIAPARVVNRISPMASNFSKPYQAQLIQKCGFDVPETLITNNPDLVREFRKKHGRIIYKSISGARSIVQTLSDNDIHRLDYIRWCPTQFQKYIEGNDIRVHTVNNEAYATLINTGATDYRYAYQQEGESAKLSAYELPDEIAEKCLRLADGLGLAFAGIDLKITPDSKVYCFEVNPCPAFSYYEANTGQPIANAVARYLAGED